jgi:arginine decarboxylase
MTSWNLQQARETYAIDHWGAEYFDINSQGRVSVHPKGTRNDEGIDLHRVIAGVREEGLALPVLLRFTDILRHRVSLLHEAFALAREDAEYEGNYTPVYPIKVNQQRAVIKGILDHGRAVVGLEAGSKPELLAVLAMANNSGIVICNGYKDSAYIRLALIGRRLGLNVIIVIEKLSELATVIAESRDLGITPRLGVRVRLSSISSGKWQNSGGEKSKFGLHAAEILTLVQQLKAVDGLPWLKLMHFHMGSQVANISDIKTAMREAGRYYAELHRLGAAIEYADVGGGLGIDYEGTHSISECSINYSVHEYAACIVRAFEDVCSAHQLPHPNLLSESGRAMSAHHAVLVTSVVDIERVEDQTPALTQSDKLPLQNLSDILERVEQEPVLPLYHDAQFDLKEARAMYVSGQLSLAELAEAESLSASISLRVRARLDVRLRAHRETLDELNDKLADKFFCNFSVFQSMPDAWAIDQIFPVMPLQRLDQKPERRAILQDLTCDSDGQLKAYLDQQSIEPTLAVHDVKPGEEYLIGMFLVGAYQEILGDMHNLFGDTHSVNVEQLDDGGFRLHGAMRGESTDDLLRYVHIKRDMLEIAFHRKLMEANIAPEQRKQFENELVAGLSAYTYLEA